MAEKPIGMTDRLLRDIQASLADQTKMLKRQGTDIREMRREMHDWQETTATALGFAGHANVRIESLQKQVDELAARLEKLERLP